MAVAEALVFREDAAAQQRNPHDTEILRVGGEGHGVVLKAVTGCGLLQDGENPVAVRPSSRRIGNQGRAAHFGEPARALKQRIMKAHHLVGRVVLDFGQPEFHGHDVIDTAAQVGHSQAHEGLEKQSG